MNVNIKLNNMLAGGDEVNAVVLEVGSHWTKAGYAGEDMPRTAFASVAGCVPSTQDDASTGTLLVHPCTVIIH